MTNIPSKQEIIDKLTTVNETAKYFGVSWPTFKKWLNHYNIKTLDHDAASRHANAKKRGIAINQQSHDILQDYKWLYQKWVVELLSQKSIATLAGCSETIVKQYLIKYGILNKKYQNKKAAKDQAIQEYLEGKKLSECSQPQSSISRWLQEQEIQARSPNSYDKPFTKISKQHKEISDFLQEIDIKHLINNRTICGTEIDILIESHKLGIEVNGLLYHSEMYSKNMNYHLNKSNLANQAGYSLFHIFEDQWKHKKEICKSMLRAKLGCIQNKIHARKCIIKSVDSAERILFLQNNHIQGQDNASLAYGLFDRDELVSLITFRTPRFNKKYKWELVRFASKLNTLVVGGFQKLLHHFQKHHSGSIVSYSDRSYSDGNIYKLSGFQNLGTNKPSYYYCDFNKTKRMPRTQFTKKALASKGIDTSILTEKEIMSQIGYKRIWDCGTIRWVLLDK